jgi:hypothetical protein
LWGPGRSGVHIRGAANCAAQAQLAVRLRRLYPTGLEMTSRKYESFITAKVLNTDALAMIFRIEATWDAQRGPGGSGLKEGGRHAARRNGGTAQSA